MSLIVHIADIISIKKGLFPDVVTLKHSNLAIHPKGEKKKDLQRVLKCFQ